MSFAPLVCDSTCFKCHAPAAFTGALLDSQPMDSYAPAQPLRNANAHGVQVRAVDACVTHGDSTLERRAVGERGALRPGLRLQGTRYDLADRGQSATPQDKLAAGRQTGNDENCTVSSLP
jgi:error-prone DNA polymerase